MEMKEIHRYACDLCKTEYANEQDAMDCEAYHLRPKKVIGKRYVNMRKDACRAPLEITMQMENGDAYTYRRTKK